MTQERYDSLPYMYDGRSGYLQCCWIPIQLAVDWFESKNLRMPAHLFPSPRQEQIAASRTGTTPTNTSAAEAAAVPIMQLTSRRRRPAGLNFAASDAPLVREMKRMIDEREARGPWDAALSMVGRALGPGNAESKAKRLCGRYSDMFGAEHDRED